MPSQRHIRKSVRGCWLNGDMPEPSEFIPAFAEFISASPTSYHAAATMAELLDRAGFTALDERSPWDDVTGKHYLMRGGAVIAWTTPADMQAASGARIIGTHTDSPALRLKPNPQVTNAGWQQLEMEIYGGPLLNSWLDRELGLAGRLISRDGKAYLVRTGPLMRVSQIAPHLDHSVNQSLSIDPQLHLMPSYGLGSEPEVVEMLCAIAGISPRDYAAGDIFAFPTQAPAVFGNQGEFFASSRLDNLSSTFPALAALLHAQPGRDIALLAAFDHEEVGSATISGAAGSLLSDTLTRIADRLGLSGDAYQAFLARSTCMSADAAHAVNPNFVSKYDPLHQPQLNHGPVLKVNAKQRYATDGMTSAIWQRAVQVAGVPHQVFVSNNDVPCGSTIGPFTASRLGIPTVDVGIPLLSMHSTREMCGSQDPYYLSKAMEAYWAGA